MGLLRNPRWSPNPTDRTPGLCILAKSARAVPRVNTLGSCFLCRRNGLDRHVQHQFNPVPMPNPTKKQYDRTRVQWQCMLHYTLGLGFRNVPLEAYRKIWGSYGRQAFQREDAPSRLV